MSATSAAWKEVMPPGFGSWPPRSVHVMPGTPVRVFVRTDSDLLEVSSPEAFAPIFPLGPVAEIALSPDRTTYLGVSSSNLRSCVLTTGVCTDITTTGLGAGEILSAVWFDPYDAARILVNTTDGLARHTYYSTNGGTAFTVLPCPTNSLTVRPLTVPGNPGTFVVTTTATNSTPQTIQVTKNAGATWTALKFPTTTMTDVSGLAVDAAGALFLLREGTLFSRSL